MKHTSITEALATIDGLDAGKPRKNIVVLGAGIAGLVAAHELSRLGHTVEIIEAQKRVGGRAHTWRPDKDAYHEFGAMRIHSTHDYTHYYISQCGLGTRKFINHHDDEDTFYFLRGLASTHREALVKILPNYRLSNREREIVETAGTPLALMSVLGEAIKRLKSSEDHLNALFAQGPMTDYVRELESQTLHDYLRSHLDTDDAVELVGAVTGLEVWWSKAVTMILREEITQEKSTGLVEIIGGTDLLPTGLSEILKRRTNVTFTLNTEVRSIYKRGDGVHLKVRARQEGAELVCRDADFVLCTLPFGVMRRMDLNGLSPRKMRAIRNLNYASSTKVLHHCKERFWESDEYRILGGGSQMDLVNRQIYYPSAEVTTAPVVEQSQLSSALLRYDVIDKMQIAKIPSATALRPGVLVGSYCWGADARRLGALSNDERARVVQECVSHVHPEIQDSHMVKESASIFWDEHDWAAGAFCFMKPGDFEKYYQDTIATEGRLFFAGEHCSLDQGWMQGAAESAIRAVSGLVA
jgi:monoamine oxidase